MKKTGPGKVRTSLLFRGEISGRAIQRRGSRIGLFMLDATLIPLSNGSSKFCNELSLLDKDQ